ncbi:hypothetical protein SOVF_122760 [Spinacia oleracea]|uniref:Transcription factor MYB97 n=1 Tax=Spinacia oleracea TaxID=3562 RepID=A0A9R0J8V9_SPIOL|nr:transcription factor MYB97-like [Spinacia oleracea]KNA12789.1 hypothetical protein SOVF_122760 [Spinacia oleracea]
MILTTSKGGGVGVGREVVSGGATDGGGVEGGMSSILKKGPWSAAEDTVLIEYVKKHGEGNWNAVQRNTGLQRCGKSCRLRWANHLRPNLKKGAFSSVEERLIIDLHSKLGNKWARISAHLPGRTDNEIKNYWNTRVKRRIRQGLSLYPNDLPTPPPQQPPLHHHHQSLPLSLSLPKTPPPTLSLFNPVSLASPVFSLNPPPPFLPSHHHSLKRCSTSSSNSFMGNPIFSSSQVGPLHISSAGFGFDPGREGFGFCSPGFFELPSNQFSQNVSGNNYIKMELDNEVKVNPNLGRTNSGLLDDLLQESHVKVSLKREREDDCGLQWDVSSSENSSTGIKKEELEDEEHKLNFNSQDLSNILELIPTLVQAPKWCNNGSAESSAPQSSAVSIDDNYNGFDDQMPQPPSFTAVNNTSYEDDDGTWNPECYNWDNLPRIC